MSYWFRLLRADMLVFRHDRRCWLALVTPAAAAFLAIGLGRLLDAREAASAALMGTEAATEPVLSAYQPFVSGMSLGLCTLGWLLCALAAGTLARDIELGTLAADSIRGVRRIPYLVIRSISLSCFFALATALLAIVCYGTSSALYDFGPILEDEIELFTQDEVRKELQLALGLALPPFLGTLAWGQLIGAWFRSAAVAASTATLSVVAFDLFRGALGGFQDYVFLRYQPSLLNSSYLAEVGKMAEGFTDFGWSESQLLMNWASGPLEGAVLLVAAMIVLHRRTL